MIDREYQEYWEDFRDARMEQFLEAESRYFRALANQKVILDKHILRVTTCGDRGPTVEFREPIGIKGTEEMAAADREVYLSRQRFEAAIVGLQDRNYEDFSRLVAVADHIRLMETSSMIRTLADYPTVQLDHRESRRPSWYQMVVPLELISEVVEIE